MFRIGELARIAGVSLRTLRHYEEVGLLRPTRQDSGYRVYDAQDLERLRRILALRDLGFPLERVRQVLHGLSSAQYLALLEGQKLELNVQLEHTQARLARLEHLIREAHMQNLYTPEIRRIPAQQVVAARGQAPTYKAVTAPMERLYARASAHLERSGARSAGPCIVVWHADYGTEETFTLEVLIPFEGNVTPTEVVEVHTLPETPEMGVVLHHGSYERLGEAYAALVAFLEREGYRRTGAMREVYLDAAEREEDQLTEIHVPVERVAGRALEESGP